MTHSSCISILLFCGFYRKISAFGPEQIKTDAVAMGTETPVLGRLIWCVNESQQKWIEIGQLPNGQKELRLIQSGKFICPGPNETADMRYCCGESMEQHCCRLADTPGLKWGIGVGVIVTLVVFLTVSYTIQVFRACDRCYHECPACNCGTETQEFQWDTRWYTVSHEGNRYGVTFHSRKFANEFMHCLESAYGRWNTANILKIQRDGQNFVILNIFFHDLFTPWFYTQGPIKNDEDWIRSDFKNICQTVQARLRRKPYHRLKWVCCFPVPSRDPDVDNDFPKPTVGIDSNDTPQRWIPWTKSSDFFAQDNFKSSGSAVQNQRASHGVKIVISDEVECNGTNMIDQSKYTFDESVSTFIV